MKNTNEPKVVSAFDDMLVAKRMIREIRLLRQFDHDNIIRIVDMLPPPSVEKFKDVYMVLDRMDTVSNRRRSSARATGPLFWAGGGAVASVVGVVVGLVAERSKPVGRMGRFQA